MTDNQSELSEPAKKARSPLVVIFLAAVAVVILFFILFVVSALLFGGKALRDAAQPGVQYPRYATHQTHDLI